MTDNIKELERRVAVSERRHNELLEGLQIVHDILCLAEHKVEHSKFYENVPRDVALGLEIDQAIRVIVKTMGDEKPWLVTGKVE